MSNEFVGTVESVDEIHAVISGADGQKIKYPKSLLPPDCRAGSSVKLTIEILDKSSDSGIKKMLNQLLQGK